MGSSNDFYSYSSGKELSLRSELKKTLDGSLQEVSKKMLGLHRQMRQGSDNELILCGCVDPTTKEPDRDFFCPICYGEKYIWDEKWTYFYMVEITPDPATTVHLAQKPMGFMDISKAVFYLEYNSKIKIDDKLVNVNLDTEGKLQSNVLREKIWKINKVEKLRLDNGRVEFIKVYCSQDDARFLNRPKE